jgi:hypothetical protein
VPDFEMFYVSAKFPGFPPDFRGAAVPWWSGGPPGYPGGGPGGTPGEPRGTPGGSPGTPPGIPRDSQGVPRCTADCPGERHAAACTCNCSVMAPYQARAVRKKTQSAKKCRFGVFGTLKIVTN